MNALTGRVAIILLVSASAAPVSAQAPARGWLDVNGTMLRSEQQDGQQYTQRQPYNVPGIAGSLQMQATTRYPGLPTATGLSVGGGAIFKRWLGVGARWEGMNYEYFTRMDIDLPHPATFNPHATDTLDTQAPLERSDRAYDFILAYNATPIDQLRIMASAGPTLFFVSQQMVERVIVDQEWGPGWNTATIRNYETEDAKGHGFGFNVGIDISYFFVRQFGIGGTARWNRGEVSVTDPLTGTDVQVRTGHRSLGAGVRLRF